MRSILVKPEDKSQKSQKCGVVNYKCSVCGAEYVGETERAVWIRFVEHFSQHKDKVSKVFKHIQTTNHPGDLEDVKILQSNLQSYWPRKITEAVEIHRRQPSLNGDKGYPVGASLLGLLTSQTHNVSRQHTQSFTDEDRLRRSKRLNRQK